MYWADIGTTVSACSHTRTSTTRSTGARSSRSPAVRQLGDGDRAVQHTRSDYGATGVSWWDWQSASLSFFGDIDKLGTRYAFKRAARPRHLRATRRSGDLGQEHLAGAGFKLAIDGDFVRRRRARSGRSRTDGTCRSPAPSTAHLGCARQVTPVHVTWTRKKAASLRSSPTMRSRRHIRADAVEPAPSWVNQIRLATNFTASRSRPAAQRQH